MEKIIVSKKYRIQLRDFTKGLLMAVLTPVIYIIQQSVDAGHLEFNWKGILMAALAGGVAYIIKQIFEPAKVITTYDSNHHAIKVAEDIKRKKEEN